MLGTKLRQYATDIDTSLTCTETLRTVGQYLIKLRSYEAWWLTFFLDHPID